MTVISLPTAAKPSQPVDAPPALPTRSRWNDPLSLIQNEEPAHVGRMVLWIVSALVLILLVWAAVGKLDIVATAEGKLVPQTLVKIVQPAEAGVVKQILVQEGDVVQAGQVLARLDTTLARADKATIAGDLASQLMQERRLVAELGQRNMAPSAGDDPVLFAQVQGQWLAKRRALADALDQEQALLRKAEGERKSALETQSKLQQTVPIYNKTAKAYRDLEKEGFMGNIASAEKQRDALEKQKDLDAQQATVAALSATIEAQQKKINQLQSSYASEAQKELAEVRARIQQLRPNLDKSTYREGLMELRAPQAGTVKDVATTTEGAVVQPGAVVMTLVPSGEKLFADVSIKNEDIGFIQTGQKAQVKLAAFPFQKYGLLTGKVIYVSADATESGQAKPNGQPGAPATDNPASMIATYKARIELDQQHLISPNGQRLNVGAGMQIVSEIHQGRRTVLEYLLSPVSKAVQEAGREK
ncbi:HlyD family type I secretion periplasmic adaptor subunit [Rhodoferax sp.]|uniref:HlyD family type I secretion periplasmic adaptor subunit n=1 Tax=Rhodoferax sp. TaxID=50421 RepID=UPI001EC2FF74|nr:HlyD family type I secretion periplasmic adaptor subunit [Rhodoferax sp.]MBT9508249.1 HlyD family type I secretion periplasmic adaptor subunit [Rhodoferax sp.]